MPPKESTNEADSCVSIYCVYLFILKNCTERPHETLTDRTEFSRVAP